MKIDLTLVAECYDEFNDLKSVGAIMYAAAYYEQHKGKTPRGFDGFFKKEFEWFEQNIKPRLDAVEDNDKLTTEEKEELTKLVFISGMFSEDEANVLNDMLTMWWSRGSYAYTPMIYTQKMALERKGVDAETFVELRKWLNAEGCLTWENKPYGDFVTSYHRFDAKKLLQILRDYNKKKEDKANSEPHDEYITKLFTGDTNLKEVI